MMKVKVLKCKDTKGNHIATVDAFEGSVYVYATTYGRRLYQADAEEEIFDGYDDAAKLTARQLRGIAMEAMLDIFPTLYLTDFRFGRTVTKDAEKYFSI